MADLENSNGSETPLDEPSRKVQLIEVAVFLFLIVPSMAVSFFAVGQADLRFMQVAISSILNDLALLSLVLYFIWRNRESIRRLATLEPAVVCAGHGPVVKDTQAFLDFAASLPA